MSPVDPRLGGNALGVTDPLQAQLTALAARIGDLQRQINDQRSAPAVQVAAGPPTGAPRDGTLYVDSTNLRLYVRVSSSWRFLGPFT